MKTITTITCFILSSLTWAMPIIGDDNRERTREAPVEYRSYTSSVVALVSKSKITNQKELYTFNMKEISSFSQEFENSFFSGELCESERFYDDLVVADCSGFLVAPDIIATAGHCLKTQKDCQNIIILFDLAYKKGEYQLPQTIPAENIYLCKEIIKHQLVDQPTAHEDFTLIRLDRKVTNRIPLTLNKKNEINCQDELLIAGHPYGIPMTYANGGLASCSKEDQGSSWFMADLDSFNGNSGSPVINLRTGLVEGILAWGADDYSFDSNEGCFHTVKKPHKTYSEGVIKSSLISPYLTKR